MKVAEGARAAACCGRGEKKGVRSDDEDEAELVTPPRRDEEGEPQSQSSLRNPAVREQADEAVTTSLSHEHLNATIFLM